MAEHETRHCTIEKEHLRDRQGSPLPALLVVKLNPAGEIIPDMTRKLNFKPQTVVSRLKSCSKGAIESL